MWRGTVGLLKQMDQAGWAQIELPDHVIEIIKEKLNEVPSPPQAHGGGISIGGSNSGIANTGTVYGGISQNINHGSGMQNNGGQVFNNHGTGSMVIGSQTKWQ